MPYTTKRKIVNLEDLGKWIEFWKLGESLFKDKGVSTVLTNGCFDILHAGHIHCLEMARSFGSLIVAINSDSSIKALKGEGRPINSENDRIKLVAALECVDLVVPFSEMNIVGIIEKLKPQFYVKGGDYTVDTLNKEEKAALDRVGSVIHIVKKEDGYSTSKLIEKIKSESLKSEECCSRPHYYEVLSGVRCLNCGKFVGNWE